MSETWHSERCHRTQTWEEPPDNVDAHHHRVVLGREVCGEVTGGYCWDNSDHGKCLYVACECPCHQERFAWVKACLDL